jgi:hypothetical protein
MLSVALEIAENGNLRHLKEGEGFEFTVDMEHLNSRNPGLIIPVAATTEEDHCPSMETITARLWRQSLPVYGDDHCPSMETITAAHGCPSC